MGKIKQLPYHEAQKIAAGEVVERPANIVKELLENSIDANSTHISLYIEDGGKQLIRIVDNGCGMDEKDALICFNRHATSKITAVNELETLETFGFRGEALASIAAVSTITLVTAQAHTHEGIKVVVQENTIVSQEPVAAPEGTDITIHNLFDNVPARKKFLKKTETEWRAIQLLFDAFCFDYPQIHFSLFSEGRQIYNYPPATHLFMRAQQIWNNKVNHHLIEFSHSEHKDFSLNGILSDHQQYRYDRSLIYFFVNKRWVKNTHLSNALLKGYAHVIPNGRYPFAIMSITIDPQLVDINIHPRKEEVKFLHPRTVESALQNAVKTALEKNLSQHINKPVEFLSTPQSISKTWDTHTNKNNFKPFDFDTFFNNQTTTTNTKTYNPQPISQVTEQNNCVPTFSTQQPTQQKLNIVDHLDKNIQSNNEESYKVAEIKHEQTHIIATPKQEQYTIIGQYKKTYILIEKEEGLFLVDQHAAQERILYELFSKRFEDVATVRLIFPHIINLTHYEIEIITQHIEIFHQNGIIIEQSGPNQLMVQSLPVHLKDHSLDDLIKTTIQWIDEYNSLDFSEFTKKIHEKLRAQMACKAAIKAGDSLTQEAMQQLLSDLTQTENRFSCPHGRPTSWLFTIEEIERKFKRKT